MVVLQQVIPRRGLIKRQITLKTQKKAFKKANDLKDPEEGNIIPKQLVNKTQAESIRIKVRKRFIVNKKGNNNKQKKVQGRKKIRM